jgi:hypothetical protein
VGRHHQVVQPVGPNPGIKYAAQGENHKREARSADNAGSGARTYEKALSYSPTKEAAHVCKIHFP